MASLNLLNYSFPILLIIILTLFGIKCDVKVSTILRADTKNQSSTAYSVSQAKNMKALIFFDQMPLSAKLS